MLTRRTPLRSDPAKVRAWRQRTARPLPKKGKKGKAWDKVRGDLKLAFMEAGIISCELRGAKCLGHGMLSFAHSLKRRNIVADKLYEVCLACMPCHDEIEVMGEAKMYAVVKAVIAARETQPIVG